MAANNVMLHHINNRHRNNNPQQNAPPAPAHVSNTTLNVAHLEAVRETEHFRLKEKTMKDHCQRLNRMINFVQVHYPNSNMIQPVTPQQKERGLEFYKNDYDFVYEKLDINIMKAFISSNKIKKVVDRKPIFYGYDNLRKYWDAIKYGYKRTNQFLPRGFEQQFDIFLNSVKNENQEKKKAGQVDEKASDPITMPFYTAICDWCIRQGYILLWAFVVCQWNCMARSISIEGLQWNMFGVGKDSIVVEYFDSKMDKKGEKTVPKNCFANPLNPVICICTALACYFAVFDEKFSNNNICIFANKDTKKSTTSHTYCTSLIDLFAEMGDVIYQWVRPGHANGHGFRKGSARECTSATTAAPPAVSVARRGDWSLGKVFDIYWVFAEAGDYYCGRILAGLNANSTFFDILPPHFLEGYENETIRNAIKHNFPVLFSLSESSPLFSSIKPLLLRCFASLVYHSDFLIEIMSKKPGHPFYNINILQDTQLLADLKKLITTEPSDVISHASGIPPHVTQAKQLQGIREMLEEERRERREFQTMIIETIKNTIEQNGIANGNITYSTFVSHMEDVQDRHNKRIEDIEKKIDQQNTILINTLQGNNDRTTSYSPHALSPMFQNVSVRQNENDRRTYVYQGRYWHVPEGFEFPTKATRRKGWQMWLKGLPNYHSQTGEKQPIIPFRDLDPNMLPKKLRVKLRNDWIPIFKKMEAAPNTPNFSTIDTRSLNEEMIESSYTIATDHLRSDVCSFIWSKPAFKKHDTWTVSNWSKNVKYSTIEKHGNDGDIDNLPEKGRLNNNRKRKERG